MKQAGTSAETGHGGRRKSQRTPEALRWLDTASGTVLLATLICTPWAFGTTNPWAVQTASAWGWVAGFLLLAKLLVRAISDVEPNGWREESNKSWFTWALLGCTMGILGWTLVAALNPRADFRVFLQRFDYFTPIKWLPQTYDLTETWKILQRYSGLACFFWAMRDWILERTRREARRSEDSDRSEETKFSLPGRIRLLTWVLVINTTLVAVEGVIQRTAKSHKVLFISQPVDHNIWYTTQFGPYVYRTNAAQLFNMVWPLAIGLWWSHQRPGRRKLGEDPTIFLLLCAMILAASPIYATSRGGSAVSLLQMTALPVIIGLGLGRRKMVPALVVGLLLLAGAGVSVAANWKHLSRRMELASQNGLGERSVIYENTVPIVRDYPLLGVGPGAFGAIYQLYRQDGDQTWFAHAHNDWLELIVCFGGVGFAIIGAGILLIMGNWFWGGGIPSPWVTPAFFWVSSAGLMIHALFDFPLKVYSLQAVALTIAACLSVLRRK